MLEDGLCRGFRVMQSSPLSDLSIGWWKKAIIYLRASYPGGGGNFIIAGRNAHPVQRRKLKILEPLKGFQDQTPITLPKQVLGLAL